VSSWFEERRADKAADARQRREDREFESKLRREEAREVKKERRDDEAQKRRDKAARRQARAARREKVLTPGNVYRKGTLGLVTLSALASLPAQIIHFVSIYWMLFPIGPAVEGAAWVMCAGVAYADERKLPVWVRWLLRVLSLAAAGFAANINYQYGLSLVAHGVSFANAHVAGLGLAAVTLGGPLFFEVRQWVLTLTAAATDPKKRAEEKARAKHEKGRRRKFEAVADRQKELLLAAPFGTLKPEDAWARAWWDIEGAPLGVTADVIADRLDAEADVSAVLAHAEQSPERVAVELLLADLFGPDGGDGGGSGVAVGGGFDWPSGGGSRARSRGLQQTPGGLVGKGKQASRDRSQSDPERPLAETDLEKVRKLAKALGSAANLSHSAVKKAVGGGRNDYLLRLRKAVQQEEREQS
jgi:hypothetical protein